MPQTHWRLCTLVGLAFSIACSGKDEGPTLESAGSVSSAAGGSVANSGGSTASGAGHPSGGSKPDNGGGMSSGGKGGGAGEAGTLGGMSSSGGLSSGGKSAGGSSAGGSSAGGSSAGGASSGGKSAGGSSAGGASSGGKSAGGSSAGGASGGGDSSGGANGSSACPEVTTQLCGMTAQHNQARVNVNPVPAMPLPSMSWDTTVAAAAQAWADQCNFSHYTAGYGQNLYASAGGGPPSPTSVVMNWVSEVSAYNYSTNACSGTCGHYTQVVWRNSTLVGCGIKSCSTNTPFGAQFPNWYIVVCNYSPAGNNGSRPY